MMVGYCLDGHHNDSHAYYGRHDVARCSVCGEILNKEELPLTGLRVRKRRTYDISATYDGVLVVSAAFVELYDRHGWTGLTLTPLPDDPTFSSVVAIEKVEFDVERRGTRFIDFCATCGRYKEVIGAHPVYLKPGNVIPDTGFVRTDLEFASGDEKGPLILCGRSVGQILQRGALRGLELLPVEE